VLLMNPMCNPRWPAFRAEKTKVPDATD